ncbi:hypothetical protein VULLAG_LOCUS22420 [Vulpes lagopus]
MWKILTERVLKPSGIKAVNECIEGLGGECKGRNVASRGLLFLKHPPVTGTMGAASTPCLRAAYCLEAQTRPVSSRQ